MHLAVRLVPRALLPNLAVTTALALLGLAAAVAGGIAMGWLLFAVMGWLAAGAAVRSLRRVPVLSIGPDGLVDHRRDVSIRWSEIESLRTLDRRAVFGPTPLLELIPKTSFTQPRSALWLAVLRGDLAVVDARDSSRHMIDLRHLDHTPEDVMAAIRANRDVAAPTPA
ncbi:MAG TPA: hypothetical protein VN238_02685 [Solirubrobacteraceae bacterium]|nr:hypothetical protein [Solirubrobacteraceae bacterium]